MQYTYICAIICFIVPCDFGIECTENSPILCKILTYKKCCKLGIVLIPYHFLWFSNLDFLWNITKLIIC